MKNWLRKTIFATSSICLLGTAQAEELFRDDFNNGVFYNSSTEASDGSVIDGTPNYWRIFAPLDFTANKYADIVEENGKIKMTTDNPRSAGIVFNLYAGDPNVVANTNPDAVSAFNSQGGYLNGVDPRLHFFNDATSQFPSRYVRFHGLELTNDSSLESEYGVRFMILASPMKGTLASFFEVTIYADKRMVIARKIGNHRTPSTIKELYLPDHPTGVEIMLDATQYRVMAHFDYPAATGWQKVRTGAVIYSGDHNFDTTIWQEDAVDLEGAAIAVTGFCDDGTDMTVSLDAISFGQYTDTASLDF